MKEKKEGKKEVKICLILLFIIYSFQNPKEDFIFMF
jgi:hypothetical protein